MVGFNRLNEKSKEVRVHEANPDFFDLYVFFRLDTDGFNCTELSYKLSLRVRPYLADL